MFFLVCYTMSYRAFPVISLLHFPFITVGSPMSFLSDTLCIHCVNHVIHLGRPYVSRAFPRIFLLMFLCIFRFVARANERRLYSQASCWLFLWHSLYNPLLESPWCIGYVIGRLSKSPFQSFLPGLLVWSLEDIKISQGLRKGRLATSLACWV